jgi:hypothetical protein
MVVAASSVTKLTSCSISSVARSPRSLGAQLPESESGARGSLVFSQSKEIEYTGDSSKVGAVSVRHVWRPTAEGSWAALSRGSVGSIIIEMNMGDIVS